MSSIDRKEAGVSDRDADFGLVKRADVAQVKLLLETTPEDLEALFRVNVFGVVYGIRGIEGGLVMR